jgi:diacylglycerol kinase family enzyme
VNPAAKGARSAISALQQHNFDVQVCLPDQLDGAVREALAHGATRVLVAGGDGSIRAAASVLRGTPCELAILPAGTLNHLARDLGIPQEIDNAVRVAAESSRVESIDVAEVNHRTFLNTSSVGAYVTFVRTRERLERRFGYGIASIVAAFRILNRLRSFRVRLEVGGEERSYLTPLVFVALGKRELRLPSLGARVPHGGRRLHVMVLRAQSGARALALALVAAVRGERAVSNGVAMDSFVVDRLQIEPRRKRRHLSLALDGEIVDVDSPLEYRVVPGALKVVLGANGGPLP